MTGRIPKARMLEILYRSDADAGLLELGRYPTKRIVNALLPLLYNQDEIIKWRAVTFMGIFMADLAEEDMEAARNVMRRFMWNLNDESGGIGWGSPEAMGEILARHEGLAAEYAVILFSYADKDGNYLELPMLQRGLLWGIARFSEAAPQVVRGSKLQFLHYLNSTDAAVRGHAARILGLVGTKEDRKYLLPLLKDKSAYMTYADGRRMTHLVGEAAEDALLKLEKDTSN
ncbi:MAG: HEAT repeat domain-containing protein [Deltaproteobacteria bacterium]|nr:HEAT repeat domain-containing protein [Deltaproteobacteria bacterium]